MQSESSVQGIKSEGKMKEPFLFTVKNKWSWVQSKCKCIELELCKCSCDCLNTLSIYLAFIAFRLSLLSWIWNESLVTLHLLLTICVGCFTHSMTRKETALWQQPARAILEIKSLQMASFTRLDDDAREYIWPVSYLNSRLIWKAGKMRSFGDKLSSTEQLWTTKCCRGFAGDFWAV